MTEKLNAEMREALESIINAKEPKPEGFRQPDDGDWRFYALEMKRVAEVALRAAPSPHPRREEPDAWRWSYKGGKWQYDEPRPPFVGEPNVICEALYTVAPPPAGADAVREADTRDAYEIFDYARQAILKRGGTAKQAEIAGLHAAIIAAYDVFPAPPPAGADAVREATIEECAKIADRAALRCVREQIVGDSAARFIAQNIRALLPAKDKDNG